MQRRNLRRSTWWCAALILEACRGFAGDLVFTGSLERVGATSLSIKLADRRVIDARLPDNPRLTAGKIAAQYKMGDQVEIACKIIHPVWEEDTSRYQTLEVERFRFLREPSAKELSSVFEFPTWRESKNLLSRPDVAVRVLKSPEPTRMAGKDSEVHDKLEQVRVVNLQYAANMPNFEADEIAERYVGTRSAEGWGHLDRIETEITFRGARADRQDIRRNGKPWKKPFQALPGFKWYGGLGTELRPLFDIQCPTTIESDGRAEVRGKPAFKYSFRSPADGCFGPFTVEFQRYNPERTGHVFIEESTGSVLRYEEEAGAFPADFEIAHRNEEVSWDYVKIGDASHLLPVSANFVVQYSNSNRFRIEVEYKNHRQFDSASKVSFPK